MELKVKPFPTYNMDYHVYYTSLLERFSTVSQDLTRNVKYNNYLSQKYQKKGTDQTKC